MSGLMKFMMTLLSLALLMVLNAEAPAPRHPARKKKSFGLPVHKTAT